MPHNRVSFHEETITNKTIKERIKTHMNLTFSISYNNMPYQITCSAKKWTEDFF